MVFSDITYAASLWEFNPQAMKEATLLHNSILRTQIKKHQGYEVNFIREEYSGEGSICMTFQYTNNALEWCQEVQQELIRTEWPEELLEHPGAAEEWSTDDRLIYRGLRVRMGVHVCNLKVERDLRTRKLEYLRPYVSIAAHITAMAQGGQVMLCVLTEDSNSQLSQR